MRSRGSNMDFIWRRLVQFVVTSLVLMVTAYWSLAQEQKSNVCQTYFGVCIVRFFAPIGSRCSCNNDEGSIIYQQQNYRPFQYNISVSDLCATAYGVCQVGPGPVGSMCVCGRNRDPGRRVVR